MREALGALALGAALSCGGAPEAEPPVAPVTPRATVVIEPPELRLGETATVELAVVTPPEHRVAPVPPPERVGGLWILSAETPEVLREPGRWVHRQRFPVRARATGRFEWPAREVEVEAPDGTALTLAVAARPFDVVPVTPEFPDQERFFSFRAAPPPEAPTGFLAPALLGACAALVGVGLLALARRARRDQPDGEPEAPAPAPAWRRVQAALAAASELTQTDVRRAADLASSALRLHVTRRYGLPVLVATTEEIEAMTPPPALAARWPEVVVLLRRLDAVRFPPGPARGDERTRDDVFRVVERARDLVSESLPRGIGG